MIVIKIILLLLLFLTICCLGVIISRKFSNRVNELKQMKSALNMLENKIKFTYETIPEISKTISKKFTNPVSSIFEKVYKNHKNYDIDTCLNKAIDETVTNLNKEDIEIIKSLGKLLGKTDLDGQISQIQLVNNFIDTQIEEAEQAKMQGETLYKKLGIVMGLIMVIILI